MVIYANIVVEFGSCYGLVCSTACLRLSFPLISGFNSKACLVPKRSDLTVAANMWGILMGSMAHHI